MFCGHHLAELGVEHLRVRRVVDVSDRLLRLPKLNLNARTYLMRQVSQLAQRGYYLLVRPA
jgi:hypothetical protein